MPIGARSDTKMETPRLGTFQPSKCSALVDKSCPRCFQYFCGTCRFNFVFLERLEESLYIVRYNSVMTKPLQHIRYLEIHLGEELWDWIERETCNEVFGVVAEGALHLQQLSLVVWNNIVILDRDEFVQDVPLGSICSIRGLSNSQIKYAGRAVLNSDNMYDILYWFWISRTSISLFNYSLLLT